MLLPITSLYAGLCGVLYLVLTVAVVLMRRELKIPYGDGGQRLLKKRISVRRSFSRLCSSAVHVTYHITNFGTDSHSRCRVESPSVPGT